MKKLTLIAIVLIASISTFAQENDKKENEEKIKKHEVKLNAFNTIIFKSLDFSYEYLLDSESSVGISVLINLQNDESDFFEDGPYYNESFAITPYYRHFFSRKFAWGFFMEAFAMYNQQKIYDIYYIDNGNNTNLVTGDETSSNFALGLAVGGKFVSKKGFLFEFFAGVGRNLATSNNDVAVEFVPRLGMSLGYRF
ncbi:MAG: DUF3575 domain-containing protein [Urechidicola sp.]|nr:DUF3575 domain-containing protein [Urechidicola sp.]